MSDKLAHQSYRPSFSTLFLWVLVLFFLVDAVASSIAFGTASVAADPFRNLNTVGYLALVLAMVLSWALKSEISGDGLLSYTWWGANRFLPWTSIAAADRTRFLGLGYYRITGSEGDTIYVPCYLSHQREFEMVVSAIAGERNPLRQCIEEMAEPAEDRG